MAITKSLKVPNRHILLNRRGVVVQPNRNTIQFASDHERDERYRLTCAALSGEVASDDRRSRFLRRLQKTAGFGTTAVVGKAVIRQAFTRQMLTSIRAYLATQSDSASLESLAVLADRAVASENDVEEAKQGVAEIQISDSGKLVELLEDLSRKL